LQQAQPEAFHMLLRKTAISTRSPGRKPRLSSSRWPMLPRHIRYFLAVVSASSATLLLLAQA